MNSSRLLLLKSRINLLLLFSYFLHSFTAILLLLMVGQVVSQGDSTKAKLLKIIMPSEIGNGNLWFWVGGLILLKFAATFAKNYYYPMNLFRIQRVMRDAFLVKKFDSSNEMPLDLDFNRYAKAFVKGWIYFCSDVLLLGFILLLLLKLNIQIAVFWCVFIFLGLLLRYTFEKIAPHSKLELKRAGNSVARRWKNLMIHQSDLKTDGQFEMELRSFKNREDFAQKIAKTQSLRAAWSAGFFPVYFFLFLFVLAAFFESQSTKDGNILQILLLIIYSQGAIMRIFKVPVHWKDIKEIQ